MTTTPETLSPILSMHARYEANMAEYAVTEKAEYDARKARDDDANAFERALQTLCREADALRAAILYQVPDTWAEATILQFHITNAYDMIATADAAPGDDAIALSVAIDTLFDFMCCEVQQDHSEVGPSFSDGAIRVHFARRRRTGVVEG